MKLFISIWKITGLWCAFGVNKYVVL